MFHGILLDVFGGNFGDRLRLFAGVGEEGARFMFHIIVMGRAFVLQPSVRRD